MNPDKYTEIIKNSEKTQKLREEAEKAIQILNNEFFKEKVQALQTSIHEEWSITQDKEKRESLWLKLQTLKELLAIFKEPVIALELLRKIEQRQV